MNNGSLNAINQPANSWNNSANNGSRNADNQPANSLNNSAKNKITPSNSFQLIDISTQTTLDFDEESTKDQLSLARESLRLKRQKRKESFEVQSKNLPSNSLQCIRYQIADLKSYINN